MFDPSTVTTTDEGQLRPGNVGPALDRAVELGELGVQVAAWVGDELIVDAWTGDASPAGGQPVDRSTLFPIFSVTKAVTATALHLQAERGLVDYDAPLARYWPEYGSAGKQAVTVSHVLTHRAGVPQMPDAITPERLGDWDWICEELAAAEPVYAPGTHNTYLSMNFGWLLGEVVRRTDPAGRPFGTFVREELCAPLGIEDLWLGLPEREQHRVGELLDAAPVPLPPEGSLARRAVPPQVGLVPDVFNDPAVQRACVPGVGGIGSAVAVARLFALLAGRGAVGDLRLLSEERVLSFLQPRPDARVDDETYGRQMPVGSGGYWVVAPGVVSSGPLTSRVLCHPGAGGTIGWADLDTGLSVAFCHNRMFAGLRESPWAALGDAILEVAAGLRDTPRA